MVSLSRSELQDIANFAEACLKSSGSSQSVVSASAGSKTQVKVAGTKIISSYTYDSRDISIFAAFGNKIVSTNITSASRSSIRQKIRNIASLSKKLPENKDFRGLASGRFRYKNIQDSYDRRLCSNPSRAVDMVHDQVELAKSLLPNVDAAGVLELSDDNHILVSSEGPSAYGRSTDIYYSIRAMLPKSSGHMIACSRVLEKLDGKSATSAACDIASDAARLPSVKISPGKFDLLLSPMTAANFVNYMGNAASMFNVESGLSHLAGLKGKKIASDCFSIYDDPHLRNGMGSSAFDAEGSPTFRKPIICRGVLKNYLFNHSLALKHNTKNTANAGILSPKPFNLTIPKGDASYQDLVSGIKKGLLVTNTWYTRFQNYATGDFSTIPRDGCFLIKNGKLAASVKGIRISDNISRVFNNVSKLGNKLYHLRGWEVETPCKIPHIISKDLNITRPFS